MSKIDKVFKKITSRDPGKNIRFNELCDLLLRLGFHQRIRGSHYIFWHRDIVEIINIQEKNGRCKPYQVKQVRNLVVKYKLEVPDAEV